MIREAKYIHFSDWPLPKPWLAHTKKLLRDTMPQCTNMEPDCPDQKIWLSLYDDFRQRRKVKTYTPT